MSSRGDSVQVVVRLRPSDHPTSELRVGADGRSIGVQLAKQPGHGVPGGVNNQPSSWGPFALDGVLDARASQATVYDTVASDIVEHALQGYNGTIMAYGQTGAGKTYSIIGSHSSYEARGIAPRAIGHIFRAIAARPDMSYQVSLSYVEIYNEHVFDLLAPRPPASQRTPSTPQAVDLPVQEDSQGNVSIKGLAVREVHSEQECMDALFAGDAARAVAPHTLNASSTRSHVIYTLHLSMRSRVQSSEQVIRAKLNLVDLAGSERVGHTQSTGVILTEARHINKSLSFLEQVVVALTSGKPGGQGHAPYRSSKLTFLLRDSLGGNTRTRLLATLHSDGSNLAESLATLKFAARMRRVTNAGPMEKNISMDPLALIARLQREVRELKQELAMHDTLASRIGVSYEPYTPEESLALRTQIARVCAGQQDELEIVNLRQVREAFRQFKNYVLEIQGQTQSGKSSDSLFRMGTGHNTSRDSASSSNTRPGSASASGPAAATAAAASYMVGEMDDSAAGGFGIGLVSAASRPPPRADPRDEPLRPSNIVKSRQRAAGNMVSTSGAAGGQTQPLSRSSGGGGSRVVGSAPSGQQLASTAGGFTSSSPSPSPKHSGAGKRQAFATTTTANMEESKSNGQGDKLPALRTSSNSFTSPSRSQANLSSSSPTHANNTSSSSFSPSPSSSSASGSAEAAAFAAFKSGGVGFDASELVASAKTEWTARRRDLRAASLRVNELKRRIDALSAPLAARRAEREAAAMSGSGDLYASAPSGVEVLDEDEYAMLQEVSAAKAEYRAAYAERVEVEAAALAAEQAVTEARQELFGAFSRWFQEQYGVEPSTNIGGGGGGGGGGNTVGNDTGNMSVSPRAADRLSRLSRAARASQLAAEEQAFAAQLEGLDAEARSFLIAARNRERTRKHAERTMGEGGRRPYVGAAFR